MCVVLLLWLLLFFAAPVSSLRLPNLRTAPVLRVNLSNLSTTNQQAQIQELVALRQPVIFSHSNVSQWPALSKWVSSTYLHAAFQADSLPVKTSQHNVFTLYALDAKRKASEVPLQGGPVEKVRQYQYSNMSLPAIFDAQNTNSTDSTYRYYAGPLPTALTPDVNLDALIVDTVHSKMSRGIVWMGNQGATAQTHFDRSYNMFAQIVGRKSFYLFAPEHWKVLHLYPSFSGSRRQCRYRFPMTEALDAAAGGVAAAAAVDADAPAMNALLATLNPGELLFVPPFYFHTVVSLSAQTISYSVLSPSPEEYHYGSALYAKVPFLKVGTPGSRRLRLGAVLYINQILKQMNRNNNQVMQSLYDSRHGSVGATVQHVEQPAMLLDNYCKFASKIERIKLAKVLKLKPAVRNVTRAFEHIAQSSGGGLPEQQGAHDILLMDLIEELLVFVTVAERAIGVTVQGEEVEENKKSGRNRVAKVIVDCWDIHVLKQQH